MARSFGACLQRSVPPGRWRIMGYDRNKAVAEFRRMVVWIAIAGILLVIASLWYLSLYGPLRLHMVVATIAGVFVSILLGCGLFAAAFFSDKSGHDQSVTDATRRRPEDD
jgi:hypothetical protein